MRRISNDAAEAWSVGFQDAGTPMMKGVVELYNNVMYYVMILLILVLWMLISGIMGKRSVWQRIKWGGEKGEKGIREDKSSYVEIIWTITPAIILIGIALPSFKLLYLMDEVMDPSITLKAVGHQWYWSAPFNYGLLWEVGGMHLAAYIFAEIRYEANNLLDVYEAYIINSILATEEDAERLKGQEHVVEANLSGRGLNENSSQAKDEMMISNGLFGVTLPFRIAQKAWISHQKVKFSCQSESAEKRWLSTTGQIRSSKTSSKANHGNLGLAKVGNDYANGGFVLVRKDSNEGNQPNMPNKFATVNRNVAKDVGLLPIYEGIGPWVGNYHAFFEVDLYKIAYQKIKSKPGNMTPGIDKETLDGISIDWLEGVISSMKDKSFKFKPALRKMIPKIPASRGFRPLGIPTPRDKVIQELFRMIVEPLVEPVFRNSSHGFRPGKSCHTAIKEVRKWSGITWMIEGDIKGFFDNVNHKILSEILQEHVKDQGIIEIYWKMVKAGYVNNGKLEPNLMTGVPQGGIISPLLSNIYLHKLDKFMENLQEEFNSKGRKISKENPEYSKALRDLIKAKRSGNLEAIRKAEIHRSSINSVVRTGRRVYYVRYADDWIIGVTGDREFAQHVKQEVKDFLAERLALELSEDKTKITCMTKDKANFLGTEISRFGRNYTNTLRKVGNKRIRPVNQRIVMYAPMMKLLGKLEDQKFIQKEKGVYVPKSITKWIYLKPEEILVRYSGIIRGILNYYSFVNNRNMLSRLVYYLKFSCVFTLARKWNISPRKVFIKVGNQVVYKDKRLFLPKTLSKQPLTFNMIKQGQTEVADPFKIKFFELRNMVMDKPCEICGSTEKVEMHHVKHIRKGKIKGFTKFMAAMNRKQIPVCRNCHMIIHSGLYDGKKL